MNFLTVLPLAIVMVAGPQLLSAIFLATSEQWRRNSTLFVVGAAASITIIVLLAYYLSTGAVSQGQSNNTLDIIILALLLIAMVYVYRTRGQSEPPRWMGRLQTASPGFSFRLGFFLLGVFPTDIITSVTVGAHLASNNAPWTDAIPFILVTLLFLALPGLAVAALGERAKTFLPKVRDWMNANSWIVSEIVLLFFVIITLA